MIITKIKFKIIKYKYYNIIEIRNLNFEKQNFIYFNHNST